MNLPVQLTCPLGHKCEEAKDNVIHRCAWFTKLSGQNPNSNEVVDEYGCAMAWLPILLIENARVSRGTSAAVESFRNEVSKGNDVLRTAVIHDLIEKRDSLPKLVSNKE